ncbi:MAG: hypothetical protein ACLSVD_02940 [Eggerthellaceae bacterium]
MSDVPYCPTCLYDGYWRLASAGAEVRGAALRRMRPRLPLQAPWEGGDAS